VVTVEQLVLRWGPVAVVDPGTAALAAWGSGAPVPRRRERLAKAEQLALFAATVAGPALPGMPGIPATAAIVGMAALPVARGGWIVRWKVPSGSRTGCLWTVARRADGTMGCSCPGWTLHAARPECRHIRAVRAAEATS
jgi:hypothetical protein